MLEFIGIVEKNTVKNAVIVEEENCCRKFSSELPDIRRKLRRTFFETAVRQQKKKRRKNVKSAVKYTVKERKCHQNCMDIRRQICRKLHKNLMSEESISIALVLQKKANKNKVQKKQKSLHTDKSRISEVEQVVEEVD